MKLNPPRGRATTTSEQFEISTQKEFICVCAWCKKVRDEEHRWTRSDSCLSAHSLLQVSHGICPDCFFDLVARIPERTATQKSSTGLFTLGNTKPKPLGHYPALRALGDID